MDRYLKSQIQKDLKQKMVFLSGPRQVGKTTLALNVLGSNEEHPAYYNWDISSRRQALLNTELPANETLLVIDEIHKYPKWRDLLKGLYDGNKSKLSILVTGSARLNVYSRGGDTLQGRYHSLRLHPYSLSELNEKPTRADTEQLLNFGGFPEPFLSAEQTFWRRWQRERRRLVVKEDIVDLENVKELQLLELLVDALPSKVGSLLSVRALQEDLGVAHDTVKRWITILENVFFSYKIMPYGAPKIRAVKKRQKLYLWDWSLCENPGAKFENLVASYLLKYCHYIEDTLGFDCELRYLRDTDGREIDFIVMKNKEPLFAVECKHGDGQVSPHLKYFAEKVPIPKLYQVHLGKRDFESKGIRVLPFESFVSELELTQ